MVFMLTGQFAGQPLYLHGRLAERLGALRDPPFQPGPLFCQGLQCPFSTQLAQITLIRILQIKPANETRQAKQGDRERQVPARQAIIGLQRQPERLAEIIQLPLKYPLAECQQIIRPAGGRHGFGDLPALCIPIHQAGRGLGQRPARKAQQLIGFDQNGDRIAVDIPAAVGVKIRDRLQRLVQHITPPALGQGKGPGGDGLARADRGDKRLP